jgi:cell fate (sporulation/competence/biofilm development) regulator YlbF (YheA/YmcA/DUF963 family)
MQDSEFALKALELLDKAEEFEETRNFSKAIESYEKVAEFLVQSGYMTERVNEIYTSFVYCVYRNVKQNC